MRRMLWLGSLVAGAVLLAAAANEAQQARSRIRPVKIADNLYLLSSDPAEQGMRTGGNTAAFVTAKGVTLVDTKIKGYGQDILAQVRKITDKPVTTIINTHTHWDHIQGLPFFAPFFVPGNEWDIYAPRGFRQSLRETLGGQMEHTYFPVELDPIVVNHGDDVVERLGLHLYQPARHPAAFHLEDARCLSVPEQLERFWVVERDVIKIELNLVPLFD